MPDAHRRYDRPGRRDLIPKLRRAGRLVEAYGVREDGERL
jgi:hypothetical protein